MVSEDVKLYGVCRVSVASIFSLPDNNAPMLSQALFGERLLIIRQKDKNWVRVKCLWDDIIGWVSPLHLFISEKVKEEDNFNCEAFSLELIHGLHSNQMTIPICIGSNLPKCDGINVRLPFGKFQFNGQIINLQQTVNSKVLLSKIAMRYLHAPFLKGGRSILGIDSPALVQMAFKMIGITLPRTAERQSEYGDDIGFAAHSEVGDVAFFMNKRNEIDHVGFVIEPMKIIHVHGRVKIDQLDNQGIYDLETKRYTYKLRTIRRILK
ncbi:MAG: C40 family peptidase [Bacteroidia bacterium]|nr:C40 family peptidase [Bacteroidia bacterium]